MLVNVQINAFLTYLESLARYTENTRQAYANDLKRFIEHLTKKLGREPEIQDVSSQSISSYLDSERKSGFKPSTLYRRRASVRTFAQFLAQKGLLELDLFEEKPFLKPRERRSVIKGIKLTALGEDAVEQLLDKVAEADNPRAKRDQAIIMLLLETGLSIGALVSIEMSDLSLRLRKLRVVLEGEQEVWLSIPKTTDLIQEYLKVGRPELTQSPMETALFVSQMGGRISRQGVWQILRNWGKQAKIKQTLSPRLIRHTAAKIMIEDGRSLEDIQRLLGHRNLFSTRALVRRLKKAFDL